MLLIWGFRSRFKTLSRGHFACPQCGVDRAYSRVQARRWFTLFWIPLIPLKVHGEHIRCDTCQTAYKLSVLDLPTVASLQVQLAGATREAATWLLRQRSTDAGRARAKAVIGEAEGREWTDAELDADLVHLPVDGLMARLAALASAMNDLGRERFVTSCVSIAAPDGNLDGDARQVIHQLAAGLGLTPAHAHGVIDQALASTGEPSG